MRTLGGTTCRRLAIVGLCLSLTHAALLSRPLDDAPVRSVPLASFPYLLGSWRGTPAPPLDGRVLEILGVDDYLNRQYVGGTGPAVALYVGYYASQSRGDTMHSPLNCLPGAGWQPVRHGRIPVRIGQSAVPVNRYVVQRGDERQVVLYWYQSHGRVIASDYWGKVYTVLDAVRFNRTDAALVRLTSPLAGTPDALTDADRRMTDFAEQLLPALHQFIPDAPLGRSHTP
jgi:EpsI family protein